MDYKITLQVWNAKSKEDAIEAVNAMLDAYDFYGKTVTENPEDEIQINWTNEKTAIVES